jgi:Mono-functional DNA-alkylating methyl methanesulfonate N-term
VQTFVLVLTDGDAFIQVFGVIRAMAPFRLTGGSQDYILIASDSGRIALLQYKKEKNAFQKIHLETFGKSGCRRIVPGQYLAVDPKGRACMIGELAPSVLSPSLQIWMLRFGPEGLSAWTACPHAHICGGANGLDLLSH